MAKYLAAGWLRDFSFLLTPEELENVLLPYHLVIYNTHVPADYTETPLEEYLTSYHSFYDKLIRGESLKEYNATSLCIGTVSDLSRCKYGSPHIFEEKQYLNADFDEPPVGLAPFALYPCKDSKGRLCFKTEYSFSVYADKVMGLQLQYPKQIQYKQNADYEALRGTGELAGYQDYVSLKSAVTKLTKPLYVTSSGQKINTRVHVSDSVKKQLHRVLLFKNNAFIVM